jgi:hypothetical protein
MTSACYISRLVTGPRINDSLVGGCLGVIVDLREEEMVS